MATTDYFDISNPDRPTIAKDPDATLDYGWDWSDWLDGYSDTVSTFTVTVDASLTLVSSSYSTGVVTAFISGGTVGTVVPAKCRIVTTGGRTDDRTIYLHIRQR